MTEPVALAFVRHAGTVLVRSRPDSSEDESDRGGVPIAIGEDGPEEEARQALSANSSLRSSLVRVRAGESFETTVSHETLHAIAAGTPVGSNALDTPGQEPSDYTVRINPVLFDCESRATESSSVDSRWVSPTEMLTRRYPSLLWRGYDAVRPTVETIAADTEHGSTTLSIRALEVLRDETALLARGTGTFPTVEDVARALLDARPSMTAISNRVLRAVATAENRSPSAVSNAAHDVIERARTADREAAAAAADQIEGMRVATLSRSGTVLDALDTGEPSAVLVAESRPGGEGMSVARQIGESAEVTVTSDAAFPGALAEWSAELLLVGADAILADAAVVNKVGTFGAAVAGQYHDVEVAVVTASDKISPGTSFDPETRGGDELLDDRDGTPDQGTDGITVHNPTFERTPFSCVDTVLTERGSLSREAIAEIADEHAAWQTLLDENG